MKLWLALSQLVRSDFDFDACRQENGGIEGIYMLEQKGHEVGRYLDAYESPLSIPCAYDVVTRPMQDTRSLGIWTQEWIVKQSPAYGFFTIQQVSTGRFMDTYETTEGQWACPSKKLNTVTRPARYTGYSQHWALHEVGLEHTVDGTWPVYALKNNATQRYLSAESDGDFLSLTDETDPHHSRYSVEWVFKCRRSLEVLVGTYVIIQKSTQRVLSAQESQHSDHTVATEVLDYTRTQHWTLRNVGGSAYTVSQESTGRFLDAYAQSWPDPKYNYTLVTRTEQLDHSQDWYFQPRAFHEFRLQHLFSSRYADAGGRYGYAAFTVDQKTPVLPSASQRWVLRKVGVSPLLHGYYRLRQKSTQRFLDTHPPRNGTCAPYYIGAEAYPGCDAFTNTEIAETQIWHIEPDHGDIYIVKQNATGMCLDSFDDASYIWRFNYTVVLRPQQADKSQKWFISWMASDDPREYKVEKHMNNRFLDAFENPDAGYRGITRDKQPNDSQVWIMEQVADDCVPQVCPNFAVCGKVPDKCGGTLTCGTGKCMDKNQLTGVEYHCINFECECAAKTECTGDCGEEDDGCGGTVICGKQGQCVGTNSNGVEDTCVDNHCQCHKLEECPEEYQCGEVDNGCGTEMTCPCPVPAPAPVPAPIFAPAPAPAPVPSPITPPEPAPAFTPFPTPKVEPTAPPAPAPAPVPSVDTEKDLRNHAREAAEQRVVKFCDENVPTPTATAFLQGLPPCVPGDKLGNAGPVVIDAATEAALASLPEARTVVNATATEVVTTAPQIAEQFVREQAQASAEEAVRSAEALAAQGVSFLGPEAQAVAKETAKRLLQRAIFDELAPAPVPAPVPVPELEREL